MGLGISTRFHFLSARFEPHASDMFFFFYNLLYSNSPRTFQLVQDSSWGAGFRQVAVLSASIDACRRAGNWEAVKGLDTGMGFGYRPSRFVIYTMEGCLFLVFLFRQVLELFLGSWFYAFLLLCLSASLLVCFSALPVSFLFCFSAFPASLLSAFVLLLASFLFCFSAFPAPLLFCFCALPLRASFLFCFSALPASLLFCFVLLCLSTSTILLFLQSCVFAALLPAPLLLCFLSLLPLCFSFLLLYSLQFVNTLGETQRNPLKKS